MYSVKHQIGSENHTLANRKPSPALKRQDAAGAATNEVGWSVTADTVTCVINGVNVESFSRSDVIGTGKLVSTDGVFGLRINHNLDVHIAGFGAVKN